MKKILLIGDSIRKGYDKYVRLAFSKNAQVFYPEDNCRFTTYVIRKLVEWKKELSCGDDVDVVHWNAGLWDVARMIDGKTLLTFEEYERNIDRIFVILKILFPKAKLIFATSTPVQEELFGPHLYRLNKETEEYNKAACEIAEKHGAVVNDLYSLMKATPNTYHSDCTHYYTKDGTRVITDQVIKYLEDALEIKSEPLDYDALFEDPKDVLGI